MDNIITGGLSALLFIAFVVGLAVSIGAPPFMFIVGAVCIMVLVDLGQSIKQEFAQKNQQRDD